MDKTGSTLRREWGLRSVSTCCLETTQPSKQLKMAGKVIRQTYRRYGCSRQTLKLFREEIELKESTEVLIHVLAVSLNHRDANILNGTNPWPVWSSGIPCSDAAGAVIAIGLSVTAFKLGDRVCPIFDQDSITGQEQTWLGGEIDGVLATHLLFAEGKLVIFPQHLSWAEAACLPCAGLTAWNALAYDGNLTAWRTVLIQGTLLWPAQSSFEITAILGTGDVSLMALKLARAAGCNE